MKLSFSLQYWKSLSWPEALAAALDAKLAGVELFDVNGPAYAGKDSPTNPELAAATRRSLTNQGLSLPCVDTVGDFTDQGFAEELAEGLAARGLLPSCPVLSMGMSGSYEVAASMGATHVRVGRTLFHKPQETNE